MVTTICYGKKQEWASRDAAIAFFITAMGFSEGAEQSRYASIVAQLYFGYDICSDEA